MKVKVQKLDGSKITGAAGDIELNDAVFGVEPRADILHRVVTWQLENRRGTARPTRERSDVARTGKKWGRQKGGGTARHGDRRAPIFVGGGKAHGPRVRDFDPSLNKKVRALGLKMALSSKAKDGKLLILDKKSTAPEHEEAPAGMVEHAAEHEVHTEVDAAHQAELLKEQQAGAGDETTPAVGEENTTADDTSSSDANKEG